MGEEFLRKKAKGFKRRMDAAYKSQLQKRDLFSDVRPGATAEVVGLLVPLVALPAGAPLCELEGSEGVSTRMILGFNDTKVVELDGEAAIQIRRAEKQLGGSLSKKVREISPEGLVMIELELPTATPARDPEDGE